MPIVLVLHLKLKGLGFDEIFIGPIQWLYGKSCSSADTNELVPRTYSAEVKVLLVQIGTIWYLGMVHL